MTKEELAVTINGREYTKELTKAEEVAAKEAGLVAIFGASDDLCELRGAINDELGAYESCSVLIAKDGTLFQDIEDDEIDALKKHKVMNAALALRRDATRVTIKWNNAGNPCCICETTAPHASFTVMEDGEAFCQGIVLDLKQLASK